MEVGRLLRPLGQVVATDGPTSVGTVGPQAASVVARPPRSPEVVAVTSEAEKGPQERLDTLKPFGRRGRRRPWPSLGRVATLDGRIAQAARRQVEEDIKGAAVVRARPAVVFARHERLLVKPRLVAATGQETTPRPDPEAPDTGKVARLASRDDAQDGLDIGDLPGTQRRPVRDQVKTEERRLFLVVDADLVAVRRPVASRPVLAVSPVALVVPTVAVPSETAASGVATETDTRGRLVAGTVVVGLPGLGATFIFSRTGAVEEDAGLQPQGDAVKIVATDEEETARVVGREAVATAAPRRPSREKLRPEGQDRLRERLVTVGPAEGAGPAGILVGLVVVRVVPSGTPPATAETRRLLLPIAPGRHVDTTPDLGVRPDTSGVLPLHRRLPARHSDCGGARLGTRVRRAS